MQHYFSQSFDKNCIALLTRKREGASWSWSEWLLSTWFRKWKEVEFLINFLPFHSIANKWLIDMKLSPSDKAVSSTLFILVLPINTQIIFNFHFIRYWFSVSFNFNFRLFSRMWYLHSVNIAGTLLKFIAYPKAFEAVGKIFADVSCFVNWWLPKF